MAEQSFEEWRDKHLKRMREFNVPHAGTVAINTTHIGDDNDYSIWLRKVIQAMYQINRKVAYQLFLTDPLLVSYDISATEFDEMMRSGNFKNGGKIDIERTFTENDFKKLVHSNIFITAPYKDRIIIKYYVERLKTDMILGEYIPQKNNLKITWHRRADSPLVKWLKENSYLSESEIEQYEKGGIISSLTQKTSLRQIFNS